jgi:hypothetical protein
MALLCGYMGRREVLMKGKKMKKKFKLDDNDKNRVLVLTRRLHDNGVSVWCRVDVNDISNCDWRFIDSPSPHAFGTMAPPLVHGGIGALIHVLKEACFAHGIMKRPAHISNRNHVRAAIDGKAIWTTSNGG